MSPLRISIYAVVAVAVGLAAWLAFVLLYEGGPAVVEKDELIGNLTPGRVLYIKWGDYQSERITPCGPPHPETVIGESWWEVRPDGLFSGVDAVRGTDGRLLVYIKSAGSEAESIDVATGQRMYYSSIAGSAESLAGWIGHAWDRPGSIEEDGYEFKGHSELNGRESLVYEATLVDDWDREERINRMEFPEDQPILFRSSIYDVGQGGQRTLSREHTFLEYQVLPEGSKVPTIEVPPPTHPVDPEECPDFHLESPP